ncbi:hypothetical protein GMB86_05525 [Terrilactibacillus sp. BCM23-1]|uniref:CopG family transcriptional regulator n=1 Tax=Terrilactibacillus tamarindi TaxID=2599694 RepID=A0A6N8CN04_9BACI|nr:hypothetical protein [Terrilactibacillus tamarindi]MTT31479.1 hypothetical protein [Terrilactibacillus tamarindi]
MKKVEIILSEELEQEIDEIIQLKSYDIYVAKEEVILKVLELYTSRYKSMVKGSVNAIDNATKRK